MVLNNVLTWRLVRLLIVATLVSPAFLSVHAQQKHALIIAISDYAPETKWKTINSKNDAPIIEKALIHRGFNKKDIHSYVDDRLTKERILNLLTTHLVEQVDSGDVVYFHFSGHGQQIATQPNEPYPDPDGLDECLVPYDAPSVNHIMKDGKKIPYDYSRHIRDKELRDILKESRAKLGPNGNLFVVIDACHSGGATRGLGLHRGSSKPNVPDGWNPPVATFNRAIAEWSLGKADQTHAPMSVFSGSASNQLNFEYTQVETDTTYGSLSYALAQALMDAPENISYQALFDQVKFTMHGIAPRQSPIAEGQLNQVIFGGALQSTPQYFTATPHGNNNRWRVEGGMLQNVYKDSKIHFHKPDTYLENNEQDPAPLAVGTVINSFTGHAIVQLDSGYKLERNTVVWAFMGERAMPNIEIKYALFSSNTQVERAIDSLISTQFKGFIKVDMGGNQEADLIIDYDNESTQEYGPDKLLVRLTNNAILLNIKASPVESSQRYRVPLRDFLDRYTRATFIKQIHSQNSVREVEVSILAFQFKKFKDQNYKANTEEVQKYYEEMAANVPGFEDNIFPYLDTLPLDWNFNQATRQYELPEGTIYQFIFTNKKPTLSSYYTCVAIDQEYEIKSFFPASDDGSQSAEDFKIESGKRMSASTLILATKPHGRDFYKFIFSERAFDMRGVIATRGAGSRGNLSSLEALVAESFQPTSISRSRGMGSLGGSSSSNRRINNRETSQTLDLIIDVKKPGEFIVPPSS